VELLDTSNLTHHYRSKSPNRDEYLEMFPSPSKAYVTLRITNGSQALLSPMQLMSLADTMKEEATRMINELLELSEVQYDRTMNNIPYRERHAFERYVRNTLGREIDF
jgi:hypothetical protein